MMPFMPIDMEEAQLQIADAGLACLKHLDILHVTLNEENTSKAIKPRLRLTKFSSSELERKRFSNSRVFSEV